MTTITLTLTLTDSHVLITRSLLYTLGYFIPLLVCIQHFHRFQVLISSHFLFSFNNFVNSIDDYDPNPDPNRLSRIKVRIVFHPVFHPASIIRLTFSSVSRFYYKIIIFISVNIDQLQTSVSERVEIITDAKKGFYPDSMKICLKLEAGSPMIINNIIEH